MALCLGLALPAAADPTIITLGTAPQPQPGYSFLPYANPGAPKGGALSMPGLGDFDSLNPFILRGTTPDTVLQIWQPLFKLSDTDSVTEYAELAQSVAVSANRVTFTLNPRARFSDGVAVTAADVLWTYHTLITQGLPFYAAEYAEILAASAPDAQHVVFTLKPGAGPDTVFNLAGMYILPAHFWAHRDFAAPLREFPIGSGAYQVTRVDWGTSITYAHVKNWWAADLPADKGFDNFDSITELFFQDKSTLLQALAAGVLDFHEETSPSLWADADHFAAMRDGRVTLQTVPETLPAGMTGLAFNTRRLWLADARVRQALTLAYDFEWENRVFFGGEYARDTSYFSNSPQASSGLPGAAEVARLAPYKSRIARQIFTQAFALPVTDGSGYNLAPLQAAMRLLNQAGWRVQNFVLVDASGRPMRLEILLDDPQDARIVIPYAHDLQLLGIAASIRVIDPTQYARRLQNFDFDMAHAEFPVSGEPGSEQLGYWGCASAATPGSPNLAGVCSPAIEAMINAAISAPDPAAKTTALHALDRLLLNGWYVLPWFHRNAENLAWWPSRIAKPAAPLAVGYDLSLWWAPHG